MKLMTTTTVLVFTLTLLCGCSHIAMITHPCQLTMINHASQPILEVTLDPDGRGTGFGYLGGGSGGKTVGGYTLAFARDLVISWREDNHPRRVSLDLSSYAKQRGRIRSMSFYYLGDGNWKVVAQEGRDPDSPVVEPEDGRHKPTVPHTRPAAR